MAGAPRRTKAVQVAFLHRRSVTAAALRIREESGHGPGAAGDRGLRFSMPTCGEMTRRRHRGLEARLRRRGGLRALPGASRLAAEPEPGDGGGGPPGGAWRRVRSPGAIARGASGGGPHQSPGSGCSTGFRSPGWGVSKNATRSQCAPPGPATRRHVGEDGEALTHGSRCGRRYGFRVHSRSLWLSGFAACAGP